jgi:hypothetical protein
VAQSDVNRNAFENAATDARWLKAVNIFIKNGAIDAKASMVKAGFAKSTATKCCQQLKKHPVYIEWTEANVKKNVVTKELLNEKLLRWANSNITDYFDFGDFKIDKGDKTEYRFVSVKDLTELPREITDCISEIQETPGGLRIKLIDKLAAVAKLAEINGLVAPRQMEVGGKDGKPIAMTFTFGAANLKSLIPDSKNRIKGMVN